MSESSGSDHSDAAAPDYSFPRTVSDQLRYLEDVEARCSPSRTLMRALRSATKRGVSAFVLAHPDAMPAFLDDGTDSRESPLPPDWAAAHPLLAHSDALLRQAWAFKLHRAALIAEYQARCARSGIGKKARRDKDKRDKRGRDRREKKDKRDKKGRRLRRRKRDERRRKKRHERRAQRRLEHERHREQRREQRRAEKLQQRRAREQEREQEQLWEQEQEFEQHHQEQHHQQQFLQEQQVQQRERERESENERDN